MSSLSTFTPASDVIDIVTSAGSRFVREMGDDSTSEDDYPGVDRLNFVMSGVLAPMLCIPGMVGNILAVIVWNRPAMSGSTGRYLTAQAVSDFGVLFFYLLNDCFQAWELPMVFRAPYGYFFSYAGFPIYFFFIACHVWCTVGVTVDLCVMVCSILKAKTYCNTKVANIFIVSLILIAFIINIPHFFNFRPVPTTTITATTTTNASNATTYFPDDDAGRTMSFALTDFGGGDRGMYYEFCIHCVLLIMVPWTSVFAMNVKVINTIVRSNQRMADKKSSQSAKNSKQTEAQITRLLLGVSFSFLVFVGINCAVHCFWMMKPPKVNRRLVVSSFMLAKTGFVFNSASHFFFYCILGKRFRAELGHVLCLTSLRNRTASWLPPATKSQSIDNTN